MQVVPAGRTPPGYFALPQLDPVIPTRLGSDAGRAVTLSRFARAADAEGVSLPQGTFRTIEEVVKAQWAQHAASVFGTGTFNALPGGPEIRVSDEHLQVIVNANSNLNCYQLKPVVEPLEASLPGLGWFVAGVVEKASYYGHQLYDMSCVSYIIDAFSAGLDDFTDDAYARHLLYENGEDVPEGPISVERVEELKAQYAFWPSQLLEDVDGHAHLYKQDAPGAKRKPPKPARAAIERWLSRNRRHPRVKAVASALELDAVFAKGKRDFIWYRDHDDDSETIGALCFITWDDPSTLFEAVQHIEQNAYNGGEAVEAFARCRVPITDQTTNKDLRALARSTVQYINRWALLEKLLSNFPIWENDDEV
jgi:PRTRC genetic system protein F